VLGPSPYRVDSGSRLKCCDAGRGRFRRRPGIGQCLRFSPPFRHGPFLPWCRALVSVPYEPHECAPLMSAVDLPGVLAALAAAFTPEAYTDAPGQTSYVICQSMAIE
jgi:hypothetical protein